MAAATSSPSARTRMRTWRDRRVLDRVRPGFETALAAVEGVEGFTSPVELSLLYHLAAVVGEGEIVEIGSYLGRSTIVMAHAALEAGSPPVVAVDPHTRALGYDGEEPFDTRAQFEANVARAGVQDMVRLEHALSTEAVERRQGAAAVRRRLALARGGARRRALVGSVSGRGRVGRVRRLPAVARRALRRPRAHRRGVLTGKRVIVGKMAAFATPAVLGAVPMLLGASALGRMPDRVLDAAIRTLAT